MENKDDTVNDDLLESLSIATSHSNRRPWKKEKRFSQIDGKYIPPVEIKIELEKLEKERSEALKKQSRSIKGLIKRAENFVEAQIEKFDSVFDNIGKEKAPIIEAKENTETLQAPPPSPITKETKNYIKQLRGLAPQEWEKEKKKENGGFRFTPPPNAPSKPTPNNFIPNFNISEIDISTNQYVASQTSFIPDLQQKNYPHSTYLNQQSINERILFDNLICPIGIIYWDQNSMLADRIMVIQKIYYVDAELFINAFCPELNRNGRISVTQIVSLYDLKTMSEIVNPLYFLTENIKNHIPLPFSPLIEVLNNVRYELVGLRYVSQCRFKEDKVEKKLWEQYLVNRCGFIIFNVSEVLDYVYNLKPNEQSFYEALEILTAFPENILYEFVKMFLQMVLGDGFITKREREAMAELLCILHSNGIRLNIMGLS